MLPFLFTLGIVVLSFALLAGARSLDRTRRLHAASHSRARQLPSGVSMDPVRALIHTCIERVEDEVVALRRRLEDLDRIENTLGRPGRQTERVSLWREIEREKFVANLAHADTALVRLFDALADLPPEVRAAALQNAEQDSRALGPSLREQLDGIDAAERDDELAARQRWLRSLRRALATSRTTPYR